jgi:hypothetical protein
VPDKFQRVLILPDRNNREASSIIAIYHTIFPLA